MASFVLRCSGFALIQLVIAWVLITKGLEPAAEENAYLAAMLDKSELLANTLQPRVITVGGSNVAFGIDSQRLGERLGLQPVNFGLHAALGMHFPLNFVESHMRSGDTVVLSFEFAVIASSEIDGNSAYVQELLGYWPAAKRWFGSNFSWKRFLDREALDLLHQWVVRGKRRLKGKPPQIIPTVYQRCNFNPLGDMVGHHGQPAKPWKFGKVVILPDSLNRALLRLNQFHQACLEKGVKVYYSSPPIPPGRLALFESELRGLEKVLNEQMTIPVVNAVDEMVFQPHEFFDTQYHLTQAAAARRSRILADAILLSEGRQASTPVGIRR